MVNQLQHIGLSWRRETAFWIRNLRTGNALPSQVWQCPSPPLANFMILKKTETRNQLSNHLAWIMVLLSESEKLKSPSPQSTIIMSKRWALFCSLLSRKQCLEMSQTDWLLWRRDILHRRTQWEPQKNFQLLDSKTKMLPKFSLLHLFSVLSLWKRRWRKHPQHHLSLYQDRDHLLPNFN